MVSEDGERDTQQIDAPFLECTDNRQELFLVDWIVQFSAGELRRFKRDGASGLKVGPIGENSTGAVVAGIGGDEDAIVPKV